MFKILIVEDSQNKLKDICNVLLGVDGISEECITNVIDSRAAKELVKNYYYDLIIVDIAIPRSASQDIDENGGVDLVIEIFTRPGFKIPGHVVGLTAHDDRFASATQALSNHVISVIKYSDLEEGWEESLRNGVKTWQKAKEGVQMGIEDYNYDVAIITAVDIEFHAVKELSPNWKRIQLNNDPSHYLQTTFTVNEKEIKVVASCCSQMGMVASSVLTMKLIQHFKPKYLFMPGIAATLKKPETHGPGDIILIDESWDGGAGKITQDSEGKRVFQPVALHLRADRDLAEKVRSIKDDNSILRNIKDNFRQGTKPNTELDLHIASAVSVAGVIENSEVTKELLKQDRKLVGLEMEAYGMYFSANNCPHPRPRALALKSISDYADITKSDSYQPYASYTSASLMLHLIENECDF